MYLLIALFLIAFELVPEGLALRRHFIIAEWLEFIYRAVIVLIVYSWVTWNIPPWFYPHPQNFWKIIIAFLMVRFALADIIYNIAVGESINYIGTTKSWDKFLQWLFRVTHFPAAHFIFIRFIFLVWGVSWLLTL